jgi:cysteine desulfuration protein SufE
MNVAAKERKMIDRWLVLPDAHERLNAITTRAQKSGRLDEAERAAVGRVPGCVSAVWLKASLEDERCHFQVDAESPLVRGLVVLLAELYDGEPPAEVAAHEPQILEALGVAKSLSPTRLNGLANVRAVIREFAAAQLASGGAE